MNTIISHSCIPVDVKFTGNVPDCFKAKAIHIIMERLENVLDGHSHNWKKLYSLKKKNVYSYPLSRGHRILQFPYGIFEVVPHDLYEKHIKRGVNMKRVK